METKVQNGVKTENDVTRPPLVETYKCNNCAMKKVELGYCAAGHLLIKLIIRLVWRVINHLGEDLTEEVVEETNQEDSWTPDGQVWR